MNCLCAIYVDRNQQTFLAKMTSFVMRYDIIYHSFLINSQCLMMWGVDSPVSGVTGCFAHKLIHPNVYLSFFKPEKRNKHEKTVTVHVDQQPFQVETSHKTYQKSTLRTLRWLGYISFMSSSIWNVIIEITRIIQMVYHSDHWTFFSNRSNRIQA